MTGTKSIKAEIDALLHEYQLDAKCTIEPRSEFHEFLDNLWAENELRAQELLQPWLSIFEFGLEWLAHVHIALNNKDDIESNPDRRVPWVLLGSASAFGWSLRRLCLTGFDTPARALLRTYVESLLLCITVLHDKELAKAYQEADTDEKVVNFWHTQASPKRLHRRIMEIERNFGMDSDLVAAMTAWRREEYEVLSQSSHLSYIAAALTCFPILIEDEEKQRPGIFGMASANSHRTLSYAALTTWYFCFMSFKKLISPTGGSGSLLTFDKEDENHRTIVIGSRVLSSIVERHWIDP